MTNIDLRTEQTVGLPHGHDVEAGGVYLRNVA